MYINALGNGVLILNSQRVAVDLLEKRANLYPNRPHYISAGENHFDSELTNLILRVVWGDV